jgi:hypothetical protein
LKKRLRHILHARDKESEHVSNYHSQLHSPDLEHSSLRNNNKRYSAQSNQSQQRTYSMTSLASSFFHKVSSALVSIQKQQNFHGMYHPIIVLIIYA